MILNYFNIYFSAGSRDGSESRTGSGGTKRTSSAGSTGRAGRYSDSHCNGDDIKLSVKVMLLHCFISKFSFKNFYSLLIQSNLSIKAV